jgi:hypothetical protein
MRTKGRIYIAGAIVPFAFAAGLAPAAGAAKKGNTPKLKPYACTVFVTTQVPGNETVVLPSAGQGQQWGSIRCGKRLGSGAQKQDFTNPDTGNTSGTFTSYLGTGTMHGTFAWTQGEGTLVTSSQFAAANYTGTFKVQGGSGAFKGAKGKGTVTCTTPDGLHFNCTEKLKLKKL